MNTVISGNQLENIGTLLSDVIISGNQLENTDVAGTVEVSSEDELALLNVPAGTVAYIIGGEAWQKSADGTWESYGSGGGGSSDFSTAEITLINNADSNMNVNLTGESERMGYISGYFIDDNKGVVDFIELSVSVGDEQKTITEYIINGMSAKTYIIYDSLYNVSVSGNASVEHDNDNFIVTISGDCTITYSSVAP